MLKYLLIALLVWLIVVPLLKRTLGRSTPAPQRPTTPPPAGQEPQEMVACAHCGLHLPASEAHHDLGGLPYCSAEHARLGRRRG